MNKKIRGLVFFAVISLLLISQLIIALDTQVKIKTSLNKDVFIRFLDPNVGGTITGGYFTNRTDEAGTISATFSSDIYNYVDISVVIRDLSGGLVKFPNGEPLKIFKNIKTGWIIYIDLTAQNPVAVKEGLVNSDSNPTNNSLQNTSSGSSTAQNNTSSVSNNSANQNNTNQTQNIRNITPSENIPKKEGFYKSWSKKWTYIIIAIVGAVLVIVIIVFTILVFRKGGKKVSSSENIKVIKYSERFGKRDERELKDAEEKIRIAQGEINRIKDRKMKIKEAEKKVEEDRRYLERLKGEGE